MPDGQDREPTELERETLLAALCSDIADSLFPPSIESFEMMELRELALGIAMSTLANAHNGEWQLDSLQGCVLHVPISR